MTESKNGAAYSFLGKPRKSVDGQEKVTGHARYAGDVQLPGLLHARPVLSLYAHATITSIDTSAAEAVPGVVAVYTAGDLVTNARVINSRHSAVLAKEKVLFRGQPVVVVVAETAAAARDAADLVQVEYETLPAVVDARAAAQPGAPVIWPDGLPKEGMDMTAAHAAVDQGTEEKDHAPTNVHAENHHGRGDVEQGFAEADVIIERTYTTPFIHQTYMEPYAVTVEPDVVRGGVTVYAGTQGQFSLRDELARLLDLPKSRVRVVPMTLGGGFGAKYGITEALAAAAAIKLGRPVQLVLTRSEDFLTTTPAPAAVIELKIGAKRDGTLTAIQARALMDNGVFSFAVSGLVAMLVGGFYKCPNLKIDCLEVFTNKPQAGAYRAPGATSASFAIESSMDDLAAELGMNPLELRVKNAVEEGDPNGLGSKWPNIGLRTCLERIAEHPLWRDHTPGDGVGIAIGGWPGNMGPAAAVCRVDDDGTVRVHVGTVDISGVNSSYVLVAAEVLGVSPDQIEIIQGDTQSGPYGPPSGGSQTTYSTAGAVAAAAREVRRKLLDLAADHFEASADDLEINNGLVQVKGVPSRTVPIGELAATAQSKRGGPGPVVGEGTSAIEKGAPAFVVHLVKVDVDRDTGQVTPQHYVAVQDVGFALNPLMVTGQIQGGVIQSVGWGLHEAMVFDEHGQLLTGSFMDYDIPKIDTVPDVEVILVENNSPQGPYGARGIGEPPITAGAAAIANAIRDATGARITDLPIRSEAVWRAMQEN